VDDRVTILVRIAVVLVFVVVTSAPAWAQKTDVVTLPNGDRNTGEILELERGDLKFETDDAGTIVFDWEKIATVEAARQFEVVTSDGRHFLGRLGRSSAGSVLIVSLNDSVTLSLAEVTRIRPIGASLWSRLDGSIDAGFTYTRSSGITQFNLNSRIVYRRPAFQLQLTTSDTLVRQRDDDERDDRGNLDLSYVRDIGRHWFWAGTGRLESNESLGLTLRSQLGGWVGVRLVNSNRATFDVGWGAVYNNEDGVDTEPRRNIEGLLGLETWYDGPKTDLEATVDYFPGLSDWGRHRLQVDAAVKRELWKDFFVALNLYDTFDSAPPSPGADRNDVGVVASIGWSF
jgi:hypothetical protein